MIDIDNVPMAPSVIPFGDDMVLTASATAKGKAFVVVRAVGDNYIGGDPLEAWEANEKNGGPVWFLSFSSAKSLRGMADRLEELAKLLDEGKMTHGQG